MPHLIPADSPGTGAAGKIKGEWMRNRMKNGVFVLLLLLSGLFWGIPCESREGASFENVRGSRISWARLKCPTTGYRKSTLGWFYHPSGDVIIVDWLRKNTTMNMKLEWNIADIDRLDQMTDFPLIFVSGKGAMDLNARQKANLKEYLLRGGFLFVDDCVALFQVKEDLFFDSVRTLLKEILPELSDSTLGASSGSQQRSVGGVVQGPAGCAAELQRPALRLGRFPFQPETARVRPADGCQYLYLFHVQLKIFRPVFRDSAAESVPVRNRERSVRKGKICARGEGWRSP